MANFALTVEAEHYPNGFVTGSFLKKAEVTPPSKGGGQVDPAQ